MSAIGEATRFRNPARAAASFSRLEALVPEGVARRLGILLNASADPDSALHYLVRLHEEQPNAFDRLSRSPAGLQQLVAVFSASKFLAEQLMRTPEWIDDLPKRGHLHRVLSPEEYGELLEDELSLRGQRPGEAPSAALIAEFRRRQILRILVRDLLGYGTLSDVTEELTNLADSIVDLTWRRVRDQLAAKHGVPMWAPEDTAWREAELSVIALGKMGGRGLNYSSDIDLMFIYSGPGETDGADPISNQEFFKRACVQLTELLSTYTGSGVCYRVDLRLRPEGTLGEVCIALDAAKAYYRNRARDWELQMMIRARVSAGDRGPGRELLEFVEPLIYSSTLDFSKVEAVSEARHRISEKLAKRRGAKTGFDVKLAPGGIRDVEFLVQCLQRLHGGREPWVRHGGTLLALSRLRDKNLLSDIEYSRLASSYQFFRNVEHRLQFAEDRQTHVLPLPGEEMETLARLMPAASLGTTATVESFRQELNDHLAHVQAIYERVVHAQLPLHYTMTVRETPAAREAEAASPGTTPAPTAVLENPMESEIEGLSPNLARVVSQQAPNLAASLRKTAIRYNPKAIEHFMERMMTHPDWMRELDADPVLVGYVVDLFEHSPFFAEQLNRKPEWIEELAQMRRKPGLAARYGEMPPLLADGPDLRRFFNREMLRIQSESICLRSPIFQTLQRTSELADCAIASAYQMALGGTLASQPPSPGYVARNQMMVIALGRLGMQEFDLGSDADLVFVIPDSDADERVFWTRVAERIIDLLTAYTSEGSIFAVDTRLRPNGREGPLVQTEGAYKDYFAHTAHAWEGITYMKARSVAGDLERGTEFLNQLQEVDWRRYGQGGRSRDQLRQMRLRLESEQGKANPLKAGSGGYYDIDFALMYLRLKSAGIFFKVLNTPARIDIIEKMGHLDRPDARFLLDAATFYRAVDHALRLSSGQAEGQLPAAQLQLRVITELVGRWTPEHLHDQPLPDELAQIQARTRELFSRLFAQG